MSIPMSPANGTFNDTGLLRSDSREAREIGLFETFGVRQVRNGVVAGARMFAPGAARSVLQLSR